jgi:hypothetical protein
MNKPININNCPILERDGDGKSVGRCWYYLEDGKCPRHGDVKEASNKYAKTGELTDEKDLEIKNGK